MLRGSGPHASGEEGWRCGCWGKASTLGHCAPHLPSCWGAAGSLQPGCCHWAPSCPPRRCLHGALWVHPTFHINADLLAQAVSQHRKLLQSLQPSSPCPSPTEGTFFSFKRKLNALHVTCDSVALAMSRENEVTSYFFTFCSQLVHDGFSKVRIGGNSLGSLLPQGRGDVTVK